MSEIFLQNMENEHFHNIRRKHKIRLLARYVDDILVIYDSITNHDNDILNDLNSIHNKIKFTHEKEINNTINYLDLTITTNLPIGARNMIFKYVTLTFGLNNVFIVF